MGELLKNKTNGRFCNEMSEKTQTAREPRRDMISLQPSICRTPLNPFFRSGFMRFSSFSFIERQENAAASNLLSFTRMTYLLSPTHESYESSDRRHVDSFLS